MSCGTDCEYILDFLPSYSLSSQSKLLLQQTVASSTGSIITNLTLNPLNVIKVQLQKQGIAHQSTKQLKVLLLPDVVKNIYVQSNRQLRGFWSGTSTGLLMSVPSSVVYMASYEQSKNFLYQNTYIPSSIVPGLGGFVARAFAVSLLSPLELIRTIQSSGTRESIMQIGKRIVVEEGYRGLYRGWASTILRDCPFSALYWFNFELFRPRYHQLLQYERNKVNNLQSNHADTTISFSPYVTFLSGATSSFFAAICTHPFDVVKTRQQLNVATLTSGAISGFMNILRKEGLLGLYKGLSMRLLTVIPGSAIMVTVYETIKSLEIF